MQVARWGNSLGIRIPVAVSRALALKEGDEVDVRVAGDARLEVAKCASREDLIANIKRLSVKMPAGWKFDRDELYEPDFDRG